MKPKDTDALLANARTKMTRPRAPRQGDEPAQRRDPELEALKTNLARAIACPLKTFEDALELLEAEQRRLEHDCNQVARKLGHHLRVAAAFLRGAYDSTREP